MVLHWIKSFFAGSPRSGVDGWLSGYFDLRGDRLIGSVKHVHGALKGSIEISVIRRGIQDSEILTVVSASMNKQHDRHDFEIKIKDLFDYSDLHDETVYLRARNELGDTGSLWLDGATQLELMREHGGPPTETVFDLDFSRGGNARSYLSDGWSNAENSHTWAVDDNSLIKFETPSNAGNYILRITGGAFIHKPQCPIQYVQIFIDDVWIGHLTATEAHAQFFEIKFSSDCFGARALSTLRLHHLDAARPSDMGTIHDTRRLSMSVKRIILARLLSTEDT